MTRKLLRIENDDLIVGVSVEGGHIAEIRFRAKGCVAAVACGSAITELVKGRTVETARLVTRQELIREVGGLPQASEHASHLAMDTLSAVLRMAHEK